MTDKNDIELKVADDFASSLLLRVKYNLIVQAGEFDTTFNRAYDELLTNLRDKAVEVIHDIHPVTLPTYDDFQVAVARATFVYGHRKYERRYQAARQAVLDKLRVGPRY